MTYLVHVRQEVLVVLDSKQCLFRSLLAILVLGLLLKAGMVLWLAEAEPQLETVGTWNAESNDHMIGVNELLAYRWMGRGLEYMSTVAKVREALGSEVTVGNG